MYMKKVLSVNNLNVSFDTYAGEVKAVRGASFDLYKGETLDIVGESGSGKSVMSKSLVGLVPQPPGKITKGEIWYEDRNIIKLPKNELRKLRGSALSIIFQDPMTSLNPTMTIKKQITEGIIDRKSTRLNSSHVAISYAVFCLKKKRKIQ